LALSLLFATAVALQWLLRVWLVSRQVRHVATHRGAVPPAFAHRISLAAHQKAADYTLAKAKVSLIDITLSAAVLLCWTLLGGLDWLNRWLLEFMGPGLWQQLALLAGFAVISALIELPLSLYQTFRLEQRFGFNQMTPGLWLGDLLKSTLVAPSSACRWRPDSLAHGLDRPLWWLWAWGAWTAFNLLLMWIFPSFIAPLFNKFEPLADESLKSRVTRLMERCGFAAKGLFVMDGSRRSAHANAYFTGFRQFQARGVLRHPAQAAQPRRSRSRAGSRAGPLQAQAHQQAHGPDVWRLAAGLCAAGLAQPAALVLHGTRSLGAAGPNIDVAAENNALALLLFMLAVPVFSFFVTPLMSAMSRRDEFEADAYAMQQADGAQLASALLKLYEDNASTLTPDPWYVSFYYSHPPAVDRLARMPAPAGSL
jgi:STE24 endopeptidase